jgi:hypothetical protein
MCFKLSDGAALRSRPNLLALKAEYETALAQRPNMPPREHGEYVRALEAINHSLSMQDEAGPVFERNTKPGGITYGAIDAHGFPVEHVFVRRMPSAVEVDNTGAP